MKPEINFFKDETIANEPSRFGQSSSSEPGQGTFLQHDGDDLILTVRAMYSLAKYQHDQYVARRAQQFPTLNAAAESINPPAIGIPETQPVLGVPGSMGLPCGGVDQPVNEEYDDDGLGLEGRTRNFLDGNYASGSQDCKLSLAVPEQLIVTDPIVQRKPKSEEEAVPVSDELDLDLKL